MEALLQQYSEPEKTAYLGAIAALASADRSASEQETQFLTALAQSAQLSPEATQQVLAAAQDSSNESIAQHLDVLKGSELRYSLVADVITFAKADGQYSPEEQQMLQKMAAYLGVNAEQVQALDQAVEQTQQQPPVQDEAHANSLFGSGGGIGDMLRKVNIPTGALAKGMLGILAPILISRMMSRGGNSGGMMGGMMGGGGGMGGGLLGALGGLLGGGLLSGAMGGGSGGGLGGLMGSAGGGRAGLGGGLGSLMGVLGGLGGARYGGAGGGLGSVLGGLLGGR